MGSSKGKAWQDTLNLPRTDFPMRADLRRREPEFLLRWNSVNIYRKIRDSRKGAPMFILHDGPPYANGPIHLGTALNKILKDIALKSYVLFGYDAPYIPGWDCHGLPIEQNVEKELRAQGKELDPLRFRMYCREYAERFIDIQRRGFIRLGVFGDWDNPYKTMNPSYQAAIVRMLARFLESDLIYRGLRVVHWCFTDKTALAEAEIEYAEKTSPSIYVKLKMDEHDALRILGPEIGNQPVFAIIWTTTPWTLPANEAVAFHPDFEYGIYRVNEELWIVAQGLWDAFRQATGTAGSCVSTLKGSRLDRVKFHHPLQNRMSLGILGDHVTLEQGTGCVHTAPGHGMEDFLVGQAYGLDIHSPVNDDGTFTIEASPYTGLNVFEANSRIIEDLRISRILVATEEIRHSYPHCWRCKQPLIFRATEQWFIGLDNSNLRERALQAVRRVRWLPRWGEDRIYQMIETRPDWCISRQRLWGVPIPYLTCNRCKSLIYTPETFMHVASVFDQYSADAWYEQPADQILPPGFRCPTCGEADFAKGSDILDVWFDSGTSHVAVLENPDYKLNWPADLYLEGNDQYRGWFNSSLLIGVVARGNAPYRTCVTHGMVVDENGQKMSKSLGNYIDPADICNDLGAEILRAWVAMVDYREDMRISQRILDMVSVQYRKIRNTLRFMLGNLYDFSPDRDRLPVEALLPLDRFMLARLVRLESRVQQAYRNFDYPTVYHALNQFATIDLSAFYLDVLKDRLYCSAPDAEERRSAQTVLHEITRSFLLMMAPIFSFTADEAWQFLPNFRDKGEFVFTELFPPAGRFDIPQNIVLRFETYLQIREEVLAELEKARVKRIIGSSLDAGVRLRLGPDWEGMKLSSSELREVLMVSHLEFIHDVPRESDTSRYEIYHAPGRKCARCWMWYDDAATPPSSELCPRCYQVMTTKNSAVKL